MFIVFRGGGAMGVGVWFGFVWGVLAVERFSNGPLAVSLWYACLKRKMPKIWGKLSSAAFYAALLQKLPPRPSSIWLCP